MEVTHQPTAATEPRTNAWFAELLCRAADETQYSTVQRCALRRAGRAAFRWPVEAATLLHEGRALTELRFVGPWLARLMADWAAASPDLSDIPAVRRAFLTRTEVTSILRRHRPIAVRGDLQMHTEDSDGTASVRAMALAAQERGLEYIAITDHSKGLAIAHGMDERQLAEQGRTIRALNDELARASGPRVLRAVEMNLSPRGDGDLDPDFLRSLDVVLGAFHSRLRVTEDETPRYLAALANPRVHVLAHPRGRIFNFRLGLRADWPRVFACARERDRAVEIDAFPDRQDLDVELLELARESGVRISLGSDSHAPHQLEFLDYAIAAALHVGIPAERIVNCLPVEELLAWTASLG